MRLEPVHPQHVVALWPQVAPFLERAFVHSAGEYSLEQLKALLTSGQQTLLILIDEDKALHGALTIATENYPNACVAFVTAVGGRQIVSPENFAQLFEWCRSRGYTTIRGASFASVGRLWRRFGAREIYRVVEMKL